MLKQIMILMVAAVYLLAALRADAGVRSKAVQEAVEFVSKKFGKEAAEEGIELLSSKMVRLAAQHGDDVVVTAFKKVGPRAGKIVSEVGEQNSGLALRLLAKHGDEAVAIVGKRSALGAVARYGDDAAEAILKHGSVGEQLVETFAREGAEALVKVTPQNGRRLAMLAADGTMKPELMSVVTRYGDEACEFIWRNKGALATGAVLATFVASPEPYLEGTQQLVSTVAEAAVKPLADVPRVVAAEAAANTNWTPIVVCLFVGLGLWVWRWSSRVSAVTAVLHQAVSNRSTGARRVSPPSPPEQIGGGDAGSSN
ncbi:MAG: hypothetical protein JSS02_14255 [Planctomycetes bacterium]|nr:hypothetical protein [Planctomycetota bacterium]